MKKKRRWLWRSLFGSILLIVLLCGGIFAEWHVTRSRGEERRDEAIRKLDAEEPGWRIEDLTAVRNAALPPPEQNSADQALKAHPLIPRKFTDWSKEEWTKVRNLAIGELPGDEFRVAIPLHEECSRAIEQARTLRTLPWGGVPIKFNDPNTLQTPLPHIQKIGAVGGLLEFDVLVLAHQNKANDAIHSCHAILNCARSFGDEPTLIAQLVRMAFLATTKSSVERTLGWCEPNKGMSELQAALTAELSAPRLAHGFRGERGSYFFLMQNVDEGRLTLKEVTSDAPPGAQGSNIRERILTDYFRQHLPTQQAEVQIAYSQMLAAEVLPDLQRKAAYEQIVLPPKTFENLFVHLFLPGFQKHVTAENRTRANLGSSIIALACEQYRLKHGRFPPTLDAIPKDILPSIPTDPYVGGPLGYRLTDDGAVIYAVGSDGLDDGGQVLDPKDSPGTDLGFRLYRPEHRRRPPTPKPNPAPEE